MTKPSELSPEIPPEVAPVAERASAGPKFSARISAQAASAFAYSAGWGLLLFLVLQPRFHWWSALSFLPGLTLKRVAAVALLLIAVPAGYSLLRMRKLPALAAQGAVPVLLFLCCVNWLDSEYSFLMGPLIRGELLLGTLLAMLFFRARAGAIFGWCLGIAVTAMTANFLILADGRLIFSDDHPVFLFRLHELLTAFPDIPVYDTMWNSGLDSMYIFASGILNVFFLFYPLIAFFPLEKVYSYIPLIICAGLTPLGMYLAGRNFRFNRTLSCLAALFALCANLFWYRWCLKYGTLGFAVSATLFPFVISLLYRAAYESSSFTKRHAALLVVTTSLCIMWPLMALALLPALGFVLVKYRCLSNRSFFAACALIVALNVPWMILFWGDYALHKAVNPSLKLAGSAGAAPSETGIEITGAERTMAEGASTDPSSAAPQAAELRSGEKKEISLANSLTHLRDQRAATHPLLIFLCVPGLLLLSGRLRLFFMATLCWLLALGAVLSSIAPQLELTRMLVLFCALSGFPAAVAVERTWSERRTSKVHATAAVILVAFVFAGIRGPIEALGSKRVEGFSFAGKLVAEMPQAIANNTPIGRALFSGFVLHDLDKGHLAPLTMFSDVPMIASSHVHNLWFYKSVFPQSVLDGGDAAMDAFLDRHSVTTVLAHESQWKSYFANRPAAFTQAWSGGKFVLYRRVGATGSYFISGKGEVLLQGSSGLTLRVDSPEAVISFNYVPQLQSNGCSIAPAPVGDDSLFIKLTDCVPGSIVTIGSKSFLRRIWEVLS